MKVEDNFKRQKRIYMFYTIVPFLIFCELALYLYTDSSKAGIKILPYAGMAVMVIESVIITIQIVTKKMLQKQCRGLSEAERASFYDKPLLVGPILVNQFFVVEYRMFRKRIIPIKDIYIAKYKEEEYRARAGAIFTSKKIVLIREGKKRILVKAPAIFIGQEPLVIVNSINNVINGKKIGENTKNIYEKYDGDYPFYGYFLVALFGLYCLLQRFINPVMNLFMDKEDKMQSLLFHLGYDRYFQIGMYVIIGIFIVFMFIWKYKYLGIDLDSILSNFLVFAIFVYIFIAMVSTVDYGDISLVARKDYKDYQRGKYQYTETKFINHGSYFSTYGENVNLRELLEEMNIGLRIYESCDTKESFLYVYENNESKIESDKKYEIKFLENTHLIIDIS
ncbi:MAG: hypothetical protein K2N51_07945 [Lachnospiraceae bacterium]|nr:hypothetical protein [Lachnospiraceae bacterium]